MGHALSILSAAHGSALEKKTSLDLLSLSQEDTKVLQQAWSQAPQAFKEKLFADRSNGSNSDKTEANGISPQLGAKCPRSPATKHSPKRRMSGSQKIDQNRPGRLSPTWTDGTTAQSEPHGGGDHATKKPNKKRRIENDSEGKESALSQALERWESDPSTFWRTPALDLTTSPWNGFCTYLKQPKDKLTATQTHLLAVVCSRVRTLLGQRLNTKRRMKISDAMSGRSHDSKSEGHLSVQARLGARIENLCTSIEGHKNDDSHLCFLFCLGSVSYTTLRDLPVDEIPADSIKEFKVYDTYSPALKQRLQKLCPKILSFLWTPITEKILPTGQVVFNTIPSPLNDMQSIAVGQASIISFDQFEKPAEIPISDAEGHDALPVASYAGGACEPVPNDEQWVAPASSPEMLGHEQLAELDRLEIHSGPFLSEEQVNQVFLELQTEPFAASQMAVPRSVQDSNPEHSARMPPPTPHIHMRASTAPGACELLGHHQRPQSLTTPIFTAPTAHVGFGPPRTPRFSGGPPVPTTQSNLPDNWRFAGTQCGFRERLSST